MPGAGFQPQVWQTFFASQLSATATLTGLVGVAISINLARIVANPFLIARAAKALWILASALIINSVCIVPLQTAHALGVELIVLGTASWWINTLLQRRSVRGNERVETGVRIFQGVLMHCATLPLPIAGISLLAGRFGGLYWVAAGLVITLLTALTDSWVLLIEVLR